MVVIVLFLFFFSTPEGTQNHLQLEFSLSLDSFTIFFHAKLDETHNFCTKHSSH